MSCNVALSLSDRAYNSYESSLCRLSTFSPGKAILRMNLHRTIEFIPLTRVFPFNNAILVFHCFRSHCILPCLPWLFFFAKPKCEVIRHRTAFSQLFVVQSVLSLLDCDLLLLLCRYLLALEHDALWSTSLHNLSRVWPRLNNKPRLKQVACMSSSIFVIEIEHCCCFQWLLFYPQDRPLNAHISSVDTWSLQESRALPLWCHARSKWDVRWSKEEEIPLEEGRQHHYNDENSRWIDPIRSDDNESVPK